MDNLFLHPVSLTTAIPVAVTLALSFMAHRLAVGQILAKTGEALTHAGDYLGTSNPDDLKAMFVDAADVFQLTKTLEISAKYNGISKYKKVEAHVMEAHL